MKTRNEGILPVNKTSGTFSFSLVRQLRKIAKIKKIGHSGTLDPIASGVMVMLLGKTYTKQAPYFLTQDKEYLVKIQLGMDTDTYDKEGKIVATSSKEPTLADLEKALTHFQGDIDQIPPMFSAKKHRGKKLYELARQGKVVERPPCKITLSTHLLSYKYPYLELHIQCSKGTYIRSVAYDLGRNLGCGAHLFSLIRNRLGPFHLKDCIDEKELLNPHFLLHEHLYAHIP